ncbi:hypothetical protein JMJ77_0007667, partial [Colletotrichum scovillei]
MVVYEVLKCPTGRRPKSSTNSQHFSTIQDSKT